MNDKVLVDTSVWISFFRHADPSVSEKLSALLRNGNPAYTGLIATELRRGAKSVKELDVLDELFRSIEYLPMKEEYFNGAGDLGRHLMQKGISVGTIDLLLAHIAIETKFALYSLDNHFPTIAKHSLLRLF
ncbi:MAG: type II toxin-antitoxin system VapC family toxin [Nitrospirota bacterium]